MRVLRVVLLLGCVAACARVPQEAVELSVTVGRDLEELHLANRELAVRFFARMRTDVEAFVDEVYRPFVIRATIDSLDLVAELIAAVARIGQPGADTLLDPVDIMEIYAEQAVIQIEAFRKSMLGPIVAQEREVLDLIDVAFQRVQNAQALVTGHLASVRKVHNAQAEFLDRVGIRNAREQISGVLAGLSDSLGVILERGRELEAAIDGAPGERANAKARFAALLERIARLRGQ